ncbi:unnamed protein product [Linum trigynum]|uniref:Uncharacterized protein n=1 Tax=Linum trigynum TaxID=586398 RepID=A0AAV2CGK1_9ROSI
MDDSTAANDRPYDSRHTGDVNCTCSAPFFLPDHAFSSSDHLCHKDRPNHEVTVGQLHPPGHGLPLPNIPVSLEDDLKSLGLPLLDKLENPQNNLDTTLPPSSSSTTYPWYTQMAVHFQL